MVLFLPLLMGGAVLGGFGVKGLQVRRPVNLHTSTPPCCTLQAIELILLQPRRALNAP